jgi:outer membrane protein OmpA-like peptidoglycan-associated protein
MSSSHRLWIVTLSALMLPLSLLPTTAFAQDDKPAEEKTEDEKEVDELEKEIAEDAKKAEEEAEEEEEEEEEARESADGSYEFKRSFGAGVELGLFFSPFERWNRELLERNNVAEFDTDVALNVDLAIEFSPFEGGRFAVFGGWQSPGTDEPSLNAIYLGIEPAFAFRKSRWELAVGSGFGIGRLDMALADDKGLQSSMVLLRPFVEARTYAAKFAAVYARFGFNYWHVYDEELTGLEPTNRRPGVTTDSSSNLNEGGAYFAIGTRFGHYPEPIKSVGDSDGDGFKDDVDDCPDEPEDMDNFEDMDGCPELDNDKDTINDDVDECPLEAEDMDGFEDENGCPDPDNDADGILDGVDECPLEAGIPEKKGCPIRDNDGDGIMNDVDACPDQAEDKDGFKDEDGCPDPDNDNDGLLDGVDQCPNEAETYNGNKDDDGCPDGDQTVVITKTEIKILEQVFFDTGKATIQKKSFGLLDTVAIVLNQNPQITRIRVEGHTDDVGRDEKNLKLSKERAASVKTYLEGKEVDPARLDSEGYGETKPLCADTPELLKNKRKNKAEIAECRATNRRVQFRVTGLNGKEVDASTSVTIEEKKIVEEPIKTP